MNSDLISFGYAEVFNCMVEKRVLIVISSDRIINILFF